MKKNKRAMLILILLIVLYVPMTVFTGCISSREITQTSRIDTLYFERIVEVQRIVRDTVEANSTRVEYVPDLSGKWKPTKMVVEKNVQRATQKCNVEQTISDEVALKSESITKSETSKMPKSKRMLIALFVVLTLIVIIKLCK